MPNINLKYLITGVALLSAVMIVGALFFNKLGSFKKIPSISPKQQSSSPKQSRATQSAEPNKSNPTEGGGGHGEN